MNCGPASDELVDEVLEELLTAAFVFRDFALLEDVRLEALETGFAGLDFFADARVP